MEPGEVKYYYSPIFGFNVAVRKTPSFLRPMQINPQNFWVDAKRDISDWVDMTQEAESKDWEAYDKLKYKFWENHTEARYFATMDTGVLEFYLRSYRGSEYFRDTCYGPMWYLTTTGLVNSEGVKIDSLKLESDLCGLLDFTYGDLVPSYEVRLWDFLNEEIKSTALWTSQFFQPTVSSKFQGKISVFMSKKDKDRDRRTALRPGRAFKLMFPHLSDVEVEKVVDAFNRAYPPQDLTLHTGKDEENFVHAYKSEQSRMQNVQTTCKRKSLANSCMRHSFEGQPTHPAAAYASGDFLAVWVEDAAKRIAARCVVYLKEEQPQAGPIYGTSEGAIDLVEEHLVTLGAEVRGPSWEGARLLNIEYDGGVIAPYLDLEQGLEIAGKYLRITDRNGDYEASTYDGVLYSGGKYQCYCCDCRLDEDDRYTDNDSDSFCSDCYHDRYAYCDESGEECLREDLEEVRYTKSRWGWETRYVYRPQDYDYVEVDGYWYDIGLVVTTEEGDIFLMDNGGYFYCDQSGEYHNDSEAVKARIDGTLYTVYKGWAEDNGYELVNHVYELKEAA
jgi:hypothetical protein